MLKELNYKVNGQTLIGESFKMASDTVNEIKVSFAFEGTDWSGLDSIKAVFSSNRIGNSYEVVLTNDSCIIPHEVLAEKGTVSVNLYGSIVSGTTLTTRITSYKSACVDVLQKVNVSGSNSVVPTPATWQQELSAHTQNTTVHVTAQNKTDWNAKVGEAPSDNKTYGRKNGQWVENQGGGGGSSVWGQITGTLSNQTDLNTALGLKANASDVYTKTESNSRFALASAILDMATKTWVNAQGFITSLAGYATEAWVTAKGYATESWVNAKNYATQSWVEAKGYLTEHQSLAEYRKSADQDTIDAGKVDKVSGKGLSTEDYTSAEKTKLGGIEANADVTDSDNVKDAGATMGVKIYGTELAKDADGKITVPIAGSELAGVVRLDPHMLAVTVVEDRLYAVEKTFADYQSMSDKAFIGKKTLENLLDAGYVQRGASKVAVTIAVGDWTNKSAVISVSGVTASNDVDICPSPADLDKWALCGIKCITQGSGTLTFTCINVPDSALNLTVRIWG